MRTTLILIFILSVSFSFGQMNVDSLNKVVKEQQRKSDSIKNSVPDSVTTYNDTLLIRIPSTQLRTFHAIMKFEKRSVTVGDWEDMLLFIGNQVDKQTYKKPVKK